MPNIIFLILRRLRAPLIALVVVYAIAVLGLTLIPGMDNEGNPWRMDFFHAFYFVSFMGSTIGFGEIPYPFTDAQRLWVLFSIYISVIAWLYAIGSLISLLQDTAFRRAVTHSAFTRSVKRLGESFYLICGCGDTGKLLVEGLSEHGIRCAVIDTNQDRINDIELSDLPVYVPALQADVTQPAILQAAGLQHPQCAGVIAVTDNDMANLKIAISAKLLNKGLTVISRSEIHDVGINMESFGTDEIINPFDIFADRLAMALHSPSMYLMYEWLTGHPGEPLQEALFPPTGHWIVCGYGRFGKAVQQFLSFEGVEATIVEAEPAKTQAPDDAVLGRGTEAITLKQAGIEQAVGIIAGTDDDANNLSIIITARDIKPDLFTVARQNRQENEALFQAADLNLVMQRSRIIARKIETIITNPLVIEFLRESDTDDQEWANLLVSRITAVINDATPDTWVVTLDQKIAPAIVSAIVGGQTISIEDMLSNPRNHLSALRAIVLMVKRDNKRILQPAETSALHVGDKILFCGHSGARRKIEWSMRSAQTLDYLCQRPTRNQPVGLVALELGQTV